MERLYILDQKDGRLSSSGARQVHMLLKRIAVSGSSVQAEGDDAVVESLVLCSSSCKHAT